MDIAPGTTIAEWQLETRLGGGAFGSVWRAHHLTSGRVVAIKLLTGILASDARNDIRREIEVLAGMASTRSPYVVRVLGGGGEPVPHVVMEYVDGSDLAARLHDHGALDAAETIEIGIAIASALAVLKDAGIIHRDVKPANVLIGNDGIARLADFGIAKIVGFETITMTGQLPMTMAYAAPEVWDGRATHQSDLYAMGVLLFQCLAGEPPFTGSYSSLFKQHTTVTPDLAMLPKAIPSHLRALIRACLQKDPAARPPDAASCVAILEDARRELIDPASVAPASDVVAFGVANIGDGGSFPNDSGVTTILTMPPLRDATIVDDAGDPSGIVRAAGAPPPPAPPRRRAAAFVDWPLGWRFAGIGGASVAAAVIAACAAFLVLRDRTGATNTNPTSTPAITTTHTVTPSPTASPMRGSVTPTANPSPGTPHPSSPTPATPPATEVPPTIPPPPPPPPPTATPIAPVPTDSATPLPPPANPTSRPTRTPRPATSTSTSTPTSTATATTGCTITVINQTVPAGGPSFEFSSGFLWWEQGGRVSLADGERASYRHPDLCYYVNNVVESPEPGWVLTDISCTVIGVGEFWFRHPEDPYPPPAFELGDTEMDAFNLAAPSSSIVCTFTNTRS